MSPEPGSAFGKGGQHYTTDCPNSRIGTAGREPSRNPRAERQRRTTILPGAVNKWVRLLTLRSLTFSSLRRQCLAEPKAHVAPEPPPSRAVRSLANLKHPGDRHGDRREENA